MKRNLFTAFCILSVVILSSCKKNQIKTTPLVSLQIVNAVTDGETLTFESHAAKVAGNSATAFGVMAGNRSVKLETGKLPNTVYYNQNHDFVSGGVYTLFLGGTPARVEPVFVTEEHIVPHTENVFGVRVINLSLGNHGIKVNLEGAGVGSLFPSIAYKSLTGFKEVSAEGPQVFEFRDLVSGELIQSFTMPDYDIARYRNITLVYNGDAGNESVFRINHY